jgi:hypothetical protein
MFVLGMRLLLLLLMLLLQDDWVRHDDSQPTCLMYDSSRRRLVTAFHRPYVWQHKVRVHGPQMRIYTTATARNMAASSL